VAWQQVDLNQFSSEFTATSPRWDRFEYQAGAYFYYMSMETVDRNGWQQGLYDTANSFGSQSQQRLLFGLFPPPVFNVNTNEHKTLSVASYGEFTYTILEDLFFTGGLRVTYEEKSRQGVSETHPPVPIDAPPILGPTVFRDEERSTTNVTGRLVLKWFPVDDIMTYASFANGFKSGGFNQLRVSTTESSEFDDEKVLTYELGTRTAWFENRLIANLTGYFTDYDDFQSQVFTGTAINVRNAGRMFSYGFEGDLALTPDLPDYLGNLTMDARVGLNIAEYDEFLVAENTIQGHHAAEPAGQRPRPRLWPAGPARGGRLELQPESVGPGARQCAALDLHGLADLRAADRRPAPAGLRAGGLCVYQRLLPGAGSRSPSLPARLQPAESARWIARRGRSLGHHAVDEQRHRQQLPGGGLRRPDHQRIRRGEGAAALLRHHRSAAFLRRQKR
jgi:outer membrane receptor protein involved in Fe transport